MINWYPTAFRNSNASYKRHNQALIYWQTFPANFPRHALTSCQQRICQDGRCQSSFHLEWWNTSFDYFFLLPIHIILVFEKFICNPEILAKKCNSLRIPSTVSGRPSKKWEVSSVYCEILYSTPRLLLS